MKKRQKISTILLVTAVLVIITSGCKKNEEEESSIIKDGDGNVYTSVTIGTQVWLKQNLKTTKFNDGTTIPLVTGNADWNNLSTPGYCWYNNDEATYKSDYGALYNWYAVGTGKLCPTGWHVPTDAEWTTLTNYLTNNGYGYEGSGSDIGKSMASTSGWTTSGTAGTVGNDQASNNSSGFTALPSGGRDNDGTYSLVGDVGLWWSSSELTSPSAYTQSMYYGSSYVYRLDNYMVYGFSVRCLRD